MTGKIFKSCMALAVAVMLLTATVFADQISNGVDWEKGVVRATGYGSYKPGSPKSARRSQSLRAARMDAQRNLAEAVNGVHVTSESSMKDMALDYDIVQTRVDAIIKYMSQVGEPTYDKDGSCEIMLEMPIFGTTNSVADAVFEPFKNQPKEPFPQPTRNDTSININVDVNTTVGGVASGKYTGLVVDCSGMGLESVMSPVIKNGNGQSIYGHKNLDIEKVIEMGMASYADSANDSISRERAGSHPLVVKAQRLDGVFHGDPVVSVADADKILIANQADMFLDNCNVVFIK